MTTAVRQMKRECCTADEKRVLPHDSSPRGNAAISLVLGMQATNQQEYCRKFHKWMEHLVDSAAERL